jgi:hypothetical protein
MVSKGSYKISRRYILDGQFYLASELFHISTFVKLFKRYIKSLNFNSYIFYMNKIFLIEYNFGRKIEF